jgi:hypothetical protein
MRKRGNLGMPERMKSMVLLVGVRMFVLLPRLLVRRQMLFLTVFASGSVGVSGNVLKLGRPLVILVMRSIVISGRHVVSSCLHEEDQLHVSSSGNPQQFDFKDQRGAAWNCGRPPRVAISN